jgi:hypothetical protein
VIIFQPWGFFLHLLQDTWLLLRLGFLEAACKDLATKGSNHEIRKQAVGPGLEGGNPRP